MLAFKPAGFAPRGPSPTLGQTFDQMFHMTPATGDVIRLFFHGVTAYLGIHTGLKEKGFLSFVGWFIGIGQGIGAVCDIVSLGQRAAGTHPTDGSNPVCDMVSLSKSTPGIRPVEIRNG